MNLQSKVIIGALIVAVIGLGITLGIVLATDDDDDTQMPQSMNNQDSYMGMMQSMGAMDSEAMLEHMRDVLGDQGYSRMLDHLKDHRTGDAMSANPDVDEMMHQMMDGMMQHMPQGDVDVVPGRDEHHETPEAAATSTP